MQPKTATEYLVQASELIGERAKTYDQPQGERSAGRTARAFNAITGRDLTESEIWLILMLLKQVRQWQKPGFHRDSAEDAVAYSALLAESLVLDSELDKIDAYQVTPQGEVLREDD